MTPPLADNCTPAGAVRMMSAVSRTPLTVKVCAAPAELGVPSVVWPNASVLLLTVICGAVVEMTVPLTLMSCSMAPVLVQAIFPLIEPIGAVEIMIARIWVVATEPFVGVRVTWLP